MIQRIQTVWLLGASVVLFSLFIFPFVSFIDLVGLGRQITITGVYSSVNNEVVKESGSIALAIFTGLVALLPFVLIFLYKNRKQQSRLVLISILLVVILGVWMFSTANANLSSISQSVDANNIGVGFFLLPIAIIMLSMAIRGIRQDEKLIKSADRLR